MLTHKGERHFLWAARPPALSAALWDLTQEKVNKCHVGGMQMGWFWFYSSRCNGLIWWWAQWFVFIACIYLFCFVLLCLSLAGRSWCATTSCIVFLCCFQFGVFMLVGYTVVVVLVLLKHCLCCVASFVMPWLNTVRHDARSSWILFFFLRGIAWWVVGDACSWTALVSG